MEISVNQPIIDLDGNELVEEGKPITVGLVIFRSLLGAYQDEQNLSGEEKFSRGELAMRVKSAEDSLILKAEDIVLIKKLVAKMFTTFIVWQMWRILDK
jgi:hypothetical protein